MKKLICLLVLMVVINGIALAEKEVYVNEYFGINITGVADWHTFIPDRPEEKHGTKVNFSKYGYGAIPLKSGYSLPEVTVEATSNFFNTKDVLDYAKFDIDRSSASRFIKNFELIEGPEKVDINASKGAVNSYAFGDSTSRQKILIYTFIMDKGVILLNATAGFEDFANNLTIFMQIISSLKLK